MKEKWNAEKGGGGGKNTHLCEIVQERGKKTAIVICPYRETTVATIPAIDLIQEDKLKLISIPQIITKFHKLALLRL